MELPVLFAVCLAMRRAEVTGLEWKDVDLENKVITVKQARVMGDDGKYHIKATKNYTEHKVTIPDFLNEKLKATERTSDYVCDILPNTLTRRFATLRDRLGMPGIRFHDLRHFNASVMAMLNIPDKYQMERGGWKTKHILNRVYQHTFSEKRTEVDSTVNSYLEEFMQHDLQHEKK